MKRNPERARMPHRIALLPLLGFAALLGGCSPDTAAQTLPTPVVSLPAPIPTPSRAIEIPAKSVDEAGRNLLTTLLKQADIQCKTDLASPKGMLFSRPGGSIIVYKWEKTATADKPAIAIQSKQPLQGNKANGYALSMVIIEGADTASPNHSQDTSTFGCSYLSRLSHSIVHTTHVNGLPLTGHNTQPAIDTIYNLQDLLISS